MKIISIAGLYVAFCALNLYGQAANTQASSTSTTTSAANLPPPTPYHIVETGSNHRVWQRETYEPGPKAQTITKIHTYTELATGLYYQDTQGNWQESQELIESFSGGAIAQQGEHRVIFANNLNSQSSVDHSTPDGQRLLSNILGLGYYDRSSGVSVVFAQIQDSQGEIISANQVLYPNAFNNINADVRYTYKKASFEQDVILHQQPPDPASYGLNPATTEIQVLTEFLNPPSSEVVNSTMPQTGLIDQDVIWGATRLGHGKAFDLGASIQGKSYVRVRRQYQDVDGRTILIESVPLISIQQSLSTLPLQSSAGSKPRLLAAKSIKVPQTRTGKSITGPMKLAQSTPASKGFVLDYVTVNTDQTNYTFQGDTTYYISGTFNIYGDTTFEGGAVLKFPENGSGSVSPYQSNDPAYPAGLTYKVGTYHPVVLTSKNDNTVGQTISGSSGNPATSTVAGDGYGDIAFQPVGGPIPFLWVQNMRFCYAGVGVNNTSAGSFEVSDCQFVNCNWAVNINSGGTVILNNDLFSHCFTGVCMNDGNGGDAQMNNVTADCAWTLVEDGGYSGCCMSIELTNCILSTITNMVALNSYYSWYDFDIPTALQNSVIAGVSPQNMDIVYSQNSFTNVSTTGLYERVGAGSYYLATNSVYHNAGTTNINPAVLADIAVKTTYPPIVSSNLTWSVPMVLGPQVARDNSGSPDLGYHYDPLDYVIGGVNVYSNLTFTAGTAVGWFQLPGSGGTGFGISIYDKVVVAFNGNATQPCIFARYSTVQEGGDGFWKDLGYMAGVVSESLSGGYSMNPTNAPEILPNFTKSYILANEVSFYREDNALSQVYAVNSEFYSGGIGAYWDNLSATNCLFDRVSMGVGGSNPAQWWMRNCMVHGGSLNLSEYGQTWPVWIEECAFDGASLSVDNNSGGNTNETYCDFNAFVTNDAYLAAPGSHNLYVTNFNWQTSWFGNYYQPTNSPLINAGSTTADVFGLYHFTTQTNQVPEGTSIVDIGYHYVATDANGNPLDTNGDGIPDYLEDANGNGVYDSGDIGNWLISAYNGLSSTKVLTVYTPLQ